ncbi:hypothetical protein [Alkalibacterium olivapovliticus]|uniref:Uncharacterized protein n=1 Tax=Alkalibacterium olivapovliticus TaxID=99907 RepID=A0A2T0W6V7_9LACT|nr:hypothetical protein [Alkalibacterium olivapovliticus]PRY82436.1 hypothetical protein CLV38_11292 [Alkalibacterium olivapovliticus]
MNLMGGILAGAIALTGGLGVSRFAEDEGSNQESVIQEERMAFDQMNASGSAHMDMEEGVVNFGQMKSHMSEMHPELTNQELRDHYKAMHGAGGSSRSANFKGMGNMHK